MTYTSIADTLSTTKSELTIKEHLVQAYSLAGYALFSCNGKKPRHKDWQNVQNDPCLEAGDLSDSYGVSLKDDDLVLDIDPRRLKPGEHDQLETLWRQLGLAPTNTFVVNTPSGGQHIYFKKPKDFKLRRDTTLLKLGFDCVEVKTSGRYVIGCGSTLPSGQQYLVKSGSIKNVEEAPQRLLEFLRLPEVQYVQSNVVDQEFDDEDTRNRFIQFLGNTEPAVEGNGGDNRTYSVACEGKAYGLSELSVYELMSEYYNPRCLPSWEENELKLKVANAFAYSQCKQGALNPDVEFSDLEITSTAGQHQSNDWPECKPLQRELPPAAAFPIEALGPDLQPVVCRVAEVIQTPLSIAAFSFMAAVNVAAQSHADIEIDGRVSPISTYFLSIAESGERKSATDSEALNPHREWQKGMWTAYEQDMLLYKMELELYETNKRQILTDKKKSIEDKRQQINELHKPVPPISPMILASEPTYEGLIKQVDSGFPSVGLFNSEAGQFLGGHGMSKDHQLKTAAGLSALHDSGETNRVRAGDGSRNVYGKRVAMHLMMQPGVSALLLANRQLIDQGLISRFLVTRPKAVRKRYKSVDLSQDPLVQEYRRRVRKILDTPLPLAPGATNVLQPRRLKLSRDAKAMYEQFHNDVQNAVSPGEEFANIRGFANKAHDHAARLSATLALFSDLDTDIVSHVPMANAIKIVRYCMSELLRLIDVDAIEPGLAEAQQLLDWLRKREANVVSLVEVYKAGPATIRSANKARSVMQILHKHGYVRTSQPVKYDGSLRADTWEVRRL